MKIVLYDSNLYEAGGEERLMLEHARFLQNQGHDVSVLTYFFHPDALFGKYSDIPITALSNHRQPVHLCVREKLKLIFTLRSVLRKLRPDLVIGQLIADCSILYLVTLFSRIRYITHIHGTIMWFPDEMTKYSFLHRRVMRTLRKRVAGHRQFYPEHRRAPTIMAALKREFTAWIRYIGVRKAAAVFTLSQLMADEIRSLYNKKAVVLQGAYETAIFHHRVRHSIKADLKLSDKRIILNINRLDPRKRIELLIQAFALVHDTIEDTYLVIGGTGAKAQHYQDMVRDMGLSRVLFIGFVPEEKLLDYYATSDLFVHPNWADYAIAVYEALAMGTKVLCSTEMEFEEGFIASTQLFVAEPCPEDFSTAIIHALEQPNDNPVPRELLEQYTWDHYFTEIGKYF